MCIAIGAIQLEILQQFHNILNRMDTKRIHLGKFSIPDVLRTLAMIFHTVGPIERIIHLLKSI